MTEDEMVGGHHQLDRHEFEQTPGDSEGQGSLGSACCSSWGHKELDTTKQLNNNSLMMLSNHSVGEDSLESLGLQGDQISQS